MFAVHTGDASTARMVTRVSAAMAGSWTSLVASRTASTTGRAAVGTKWSTTVARPTFPSQPSRVNAVARPTSWEWPGDHPVKSMCVTDDVNRPYMIVVILIFRPLLCQVRSGGGLRRMSGGNDALQ